MVLHSMESTETNNKLHPESQSAVCSGDCRSPSALPFNKLHIQSVPRWRQDEQRRRVEEQRKRGVSGERIGGQTEVTGAGQDSPQWAGREEDCGVVAVEALEEAAEGDREGMNIQLWMMGWENNFKTSAKKAEKYLANTWCNKRLGSIKWSVRL